VRGAALGGDHAHATANSGTLPDVRFGSLADIAAALPNDRFTPESRHR
jgi:hypothetical protein